MCQGESKTAKRRLTKYLDVSILPVEELIWVFVKLRAQRPKIDWGGEVKKNVNPDCGEVLP